MNKLGSLVVSLGLDAAQFTAGMTKAEYETKRSVDKIKGQFAALGASLAGLGLGAAFVDAVRDAGALGREIDKLSRLANQTPEDFQRMAYAAKNAGIEQDKLADILKDVQDKVGDFLQTGAGPMADFFEQIAPRVGVTAEQFRKLGGADALQLYVSSLQKANLSQAEMTFYMEAIARDSTLLLPLLQDNGRAMRELGDEAQRLGVVLDNETIRAAKDFQRNSDALTASLGALRIEVGNAVIPTVNRLTQEFLTGMRHASGFLDALRTFGLARTFDKPSEGAKHYREELQRLTAAREKLIDTEGAMANTSGFDRDIDLAKRRLAYFQDLRNQQMNFGADDQSAAEAARLGITKPLGQFTPLNQQKAAKTGGGAKAPREQIDEAARFLEQLRRQLQATENLTVVEATLRELQTERFKNVTDAQRRSILDTAQQIDDAREFEAIEREFQAAKMDTARATVRAREEYEAWLQAMRDNTPTARLEATRQEMQKLADALTAGRLSESEYLEIVRERLGLVAEETKQAKSFAEEFGMTMTSSLERAIESGGKLKDMLKGIAQDLLKMTVRKGITEPLGELVMSGIKGIFSFDGGGYTGPGPRSGGLDGRGGFLAMMHPNETVVDHTKGGSVGGATIVQHVTIDARGADAGVEARIRAAMEQTRRETLAAVQAQAARGGSFARAVGRA